MFLSLLDFEGFWDLMVVSFVWLVWCLLIWLFLGLIADWLVGVIVWLLGFY